MDTARNFRILGKKIVAVARNYRLVTFAFRKWVASVQCLLGVCSKVLIAVRDSELQLSGKGVSGYFMAASASGGGGGGSPRSRKSRGSSVPTPIIVASWA